MTNNIFTLNQFVVGSHDLVVNSDLKGSLFIAPLPSTVSHLSLIMVVFWVGLRQQKVHTPSLGGRLFGMNKGLGIEAVIYYWDGYNVSFANFGGRGRC